MTLANIARRYSTTVHEEEIIPFVTGPGGLGLKIYPQQRFALKVLDKFELDDSAKDIQVRSKTGDVVRYTLTELGFWNYLYNEGRISMSYPEYMGNSTIQVLLCMGRRATKTTIIVAYAAYKLYQLLQKENPLAFFNLIDSSQINITMTALGETSARNLLSRFVSMVRGSPFFQPFMLTPSTGEVARFWTKRDIERLRGKVDNPPQYSNAINVYAIPNTPGGRGGDNLLVMMDEFAHYNVPGRSTRDKPLDESMYEALTPSTAGFKDSNGVPWGRTFLFSSSARQTGKFYEEHKQAFDLGASSGTLAIRAATWEMNPEISSVYLGIMHQKDPNAYDREFGAVFSQDGEHWITDMKSFYFAMDPSLKTDTPVGKVDKRYFLGGDFALSRDGCSFAIVHHEPKLVLTESNFCEQAFSMDPELRDRLEKGLELRDVFVIDYVEDRRAGKPPYENQEKLRIQDMLDWCEDLYRRWPIHFGIYDQWSGLVISQLIEDRGIKRLEMLTHDSVINDTQYKTFLESLHLNQIRIPQSQSLEDELRVLTASTVGGGYTKVTKPGGNHHDDRFDAIIRALFLCHAYVNGLAHVKIEGFFKKVSLIQRALGLDETGSHRHYENLKRAYHGPPRRSPRGYSGNISTGFSKGIYGRRNR